MTTQHDDHEVKERLAKAAQRFASYRHVSFGDRAHWLAEAAAILESDVERLARLMTGEMAKPIRAAREEVLKCAAGCRYYAENAETLLRDEAIATPVRKSFVRHQPVGVVLAIMPWNFPLWQVIRFAAPALMAGNVGLLKHAANVPGCAVALEDLFRRAGFPDGCFQTLLIDSKRVGDVIDDPRVAAVTLTGSEAAGIDVAARAGRQIKKTVLELGGSDPFIVLASANLDKAAATGVKARMVNNGQSCIAAKRFIVEASVYDEFKTRFVAGVSALKVGDPFEESTDVGPLATSAIRDGVVDQVKRAVADGARLLCGGQATEGNFVTPGVLEEVPRASKVFREEVFGPVAMLFRVRDVDEAISVGNDSPFGLGASVWTGDPDEANRVVNELETGQVFVNEMVASDPRLPFGGVKRSGYGRELSRDGILEFVNRKTIVIPEGLASD